jgi:polyketide cyclase/dehydrase/lipid transport protein
VSTDARSSLDAHDKRLRPRQAARVLQIVLGSLALVGLIIVALGAILPSSWSVERSILINAPTSSVHAIASDLAYWDEWAQWDHQGRPVDELGAIRSGAGASLHFSAPGAGPAGSVRIVQSDVARGVTFQIELDGGRPSEAALAYTPRLAATEVTWHDRGKLPPIIGALMRDLVETRLAGHMEVGLRRLKDLVERPSGTATPAAPASR